MDDSKKTSGTHLWLILLKAFHSISAAMDKKLRTSCLGNSDFRVLEVLLHKGPMPVNAIGPKVFLTPGSISTAVDRLFERGLVTRSDNPEDRRVRVVDLTPKGRTLITAVFQDHAVLLEKFAEGLTREERVQLIDALKKMGKRAEIEE